MWRDVDGRLPAVVPAPLDVRPATGRGRARSSSTTCRTPSRASTTASSGCATATAGRPRRAAATGTAIGDAGVVVKYDLDAGTSERYDLGPHAHPGEFVFVRDRRRRRRGRGLGDRARVRRHDRPLRPRDPRRLRRRRPSPSPGCTCRCRVPYGFHGSWISDAELAALTARARTRSVRIPVAPATRIRTERTVRRVVADQAADFSRTWMPHAEPRPMTWARPSLAPSIWRSPASPRRWWQTSQMLAMPVAEIGWPFDSQAARHVDRRLAVTPRGAGEEEVGGAALLAQARGCRSARARRWRSSRAARRGRGPRGRRRPARTPAWRRSWSAC